MNPRKMRMMAASPLSTDAGVTRRQFLVRAATGGGFMIGALIPGLGKLGEAAAQTFAPSVTSWLVIGADDTVTVLVPITEMGQGTMTGLAALVADQLKIDWRKVRVEHAPVDAAHGGANANVYNFRFTGGSLGMRLTAQKLQQCAANARQMLINAAAKAWNVEPGTCTIASGVGTAAGITYVTSGLNRSSYGSIAPLVASLPAVTNASLLTSKTYVGNSPPRVDVPDKVTGATKFGIDVFQKGMVFAAVKHCPTSGGVVGSVGSKPAGAIALVRVGGNGTTTATGVAAVAATTWDAMNAVKSASVTWTLPLDVASRDSAAINARAALLMTSGSALIAQNTGNIAGGMMVSGAVSIASTYQVPYLAHAALEPLTCTVRYAPGSPGRCDVWVPTQAPDSALGLVTSLCPAGTVINVINTLPGSGFGRKFELDFVTEAMQVGLACPGKMIKLTWSREQDFANDVFRPMALTRITAAATPDGTITAWHNRIVTPSIAVQRGASTSSLDGEAVHGAISRAGYSDAGLPYNVPNSLVEWVRHDSPIPVGYWRSVGMSFNTFAVECAIDELASAIGMSPFDFRQKNLAESRLGPVLSALRTLSGWDTTPGAGRARGVAIAAGFGSFIGQVAEISVNATSGAVTVHQVSSVIDCGTAVHPDAIKAQIEGAVAQAMAATLWDQQTFVNGVPQVTNFNKYPTVKLASMPRIVTQIIQGGGMGGVGEVGVPCVAPAIANAYAKLKGAAARKRSLPFFPGATMGGL